MDAFLTLNQRNFYNTLKKMSARKPQKIIAPPRVSFYLLVWPSSVVFLVFTVLSVLLPPHGLRSLQFKSLL